MAKGKKFKKTIKNPKTGRKNTVKYGAKGYKIGEKGSDRADAYCKRSAGIKKKMIAKGGESAKKARSPNSPNNLSRKKWGCKGDRSVKK